MKPPPLAGSAIRIAVALLLCAACFQAGRWYQELDGPAGPSAAARHDSGNELVQATFLEPAPQMIEPAPLAAAGDPVGESGDIITPLNVRDPSALVMGLSHFQRACPPTPITPEPSGVEPERSIEPPKPRKMKEGRLLELLKKDDKKTVVPKNY